MKPKVLIIVVSLSLSAFALAPIITGLATPPQYGKTYYAELSKMYSNIKTNERKIVLIGGSSTAFGIDVEVMEKELPGYRVCPFGLYGQIGTKAMMDLALPQIHEGDIVIISPEISSQSMSLYFSGEEMWKCADTDPSLALGVKHDNYKDMLGSYYPYLAKKVDYSLHGSPEPEDVYALSSFDSRCQMVYPRPYNILPELCDYDNFLTFDSSLIDDAFISYVNDYYREVSKRKATLYYNFCPINNLAISSVPDAIAFSEQLCGKLDCFVLGNIANYLMDYEWFYDSNFHLNTLGSMLYSYKIADDLRVELGDFSPVYRDEIEKPLPQIDIQDGNNEDASCFEYEEIARGYKLIGLKEEARKRNKLTIPTSYDGKPVVIFDKSVFYGNAFLEELIIPHTITKIEDYSFVGCTALERIVLESEIPNINVSTKLLEGAQKAKIIVKNYEVYSLYIVNYYWSQYTSKITYPH